MIQQIHAMGASRAAGARKMLFFLQRDSHSAGCTRQTPPNRVSADSPSRILPGDVLVSLRFPLPKKLQRCEWPSGNSRIYFRKYFFGPIKKKKRGRDHSLARGNTIEKKHGTRNFESLIRVLKRHFFFFNVRRTVPYFYVLRKRVF